MKRRPQSPAWTLLFPVLFGALVLLLICWQSYRLGSGGEGAEASRGKAAASSQALVPSERPADANAVPGQALFRLGKALPEPVLTALPPPGEAIPAAARQVDATTLVEAGSLPDFDTLQAGMQLRFPTRRGELRGTVINRLEEKEGDRMWVSGRLASLRGGSFALFKNLATGEIGGDILDPLNGKAYQLIRDDQGRLLLQERPLGAVICSGMPPEPPNPEAMARAARQPPVGALTVPALDSLPSATAVLYIDFDGQTVTDPRWNGGNTIIAQPAVMAGQPISPAQITAVWAAVAEDFAPFNVSVTTIAARYANAPLGKRMRCIQTPTNDAAPMAGGVAYLDSFSLSGSYQPDIPCWSFNSNNVNIMAMTISHELGHTVGLVHDGLGVPGQGQEYYGGHGVSPLFWGPIMGAPFGAQVTQWSKGEYYDASNTEDDLAVITRSLNFGFRLDEAGGSTGTAANVSDLLFGNLDEAGILSAEADVDVYRFTTSGGSVQIQGVAAALPEANADLRLRLLDSGGAAVAVSDPAGQLGAQINQTVPAGVYFIEVSGSGFGNPMEIVPTGWTSYGARGQYVIRGEFPPLPALPLILRQPVSPAAAVIEGKPVTFSAAAISNRKAKYQWFKVVGGSETAIKGATSAKYKIAAVNASHIGDYFLRVSNSEGFVDTDTVSLDVVLRPRVVVSAPGATVASGSPHAFSPVITGTPPLTIQWFKGSSPMPGETGPELLFADVQWPEEGTYYVTVSNLAGKAKSAVARLTVQSPPVFVDLPALFAVPLGGKATLAAQVAGSAPMTFQWLKDGSELPGATKTKLPLSGLATTAGSYQLRVSNPFGTETSTGTMVVVDERLRIIEHPVGGSFTRGDGVSMTVVTTGDGPVSYQWQKNRMDIPGQTGQGLALAAADWFDNGKYRVVVKNRVSTVISREASVAVSSRPEITQQPQSTKGARGGSVVFAVKAEGTPRLAYQWFVDGQLIAGARSRTLTLKKLDTQHEGDYHVEVSNGLGLMPSDPAALIVEDAPGIVLHPQPGFFAVAGEIAATVQAAGSPALRYQWQRNKRDIPGQTLPVLSLPDSPLTATGSYRVVVSNDVGRVISRAALLTVQTPPQITVPPQPLTIHEGEKAVFTVTASGSKTLRYRWLFEGNQIATSRTLTLNDARMERQGEYRVEVSNRVGTVLSDPVALDILTVPSPDITLLVPRSLRPGDKFALTGTNLRFARTVQVGGRKVSFVKTSSGQLIGTIPTSFTSGGVVTVASLGGTAQSPQSLTVSKSATNDLFANARVLTGSSVSSETDNQTFTVEVNEPYPNRGKSAWWRWVAPSTGRYEVDTRFSAYDTVLAVHQGDFINSLSFIAFNDDENFLGGISSSRLTFSALAGVTYRLVVDYYSSEDFGGLTKLNIRRQSISAPLAGVIADAGGASAAAMAAATAAPSEAGAQAEAPVAEPASGQSVLLGQSDADSPEDVVFWKPAVPEELAGAGEISVAFNAELLATEGESTDRFSWTLYNAQEEPVLALVAGAADGAMQVVNAAGEAFDMEPRLGARAPVKVELIVQPARDVWTLRLDGVTLFSEQALSAGAGALLSDLALAVQRGSGEPAKLWCRDLEITTQP